MTAPTSSNYPESFDNDVNLFLVRDGLRMRLAEDYNPGDTIIFVEGDSRIFSKFPSSGIITLTEQCSDLDKRAISLFYTTITFNENEPFSISGLSVLSGFQDVLKPKTITNVTLNVMAEHHENLKNSLIAIQTFAGVEGEKDLVPFGDTLEGRVNFLRSVVLTPKSWFSANKRVGIVPLTVDFKDLSFRLATDDGTLGDPILTWDFGDATTASGEPGEVITKTYTNPGVYTVKLTVENDFGSDVCEFPDFINARIEAPDEAVIKINQLSEFQDVFNGFPLNGPYINNPTIRSPINTLIEFEVPNIPNPNTPGRSYGGELLSGSTPIDPISNYTWNLGDDLFHENSNFARASYSVGGIYDLKLRVDTDFNSYRITTYENVIDVIENKNLWLWTFQTSSTVRSYEYGLISETFKTVPVPTLTVTRNDSFLDSVNNSAKQKQEFKRNVGFAPIGQSNSATKGRTVLYWASGRNLSNSPSSETIYFYEYEGFGHIYTSKGVVNRPWNWLSFNSSSQAFFLFGSPNIPDVPNLSLTNPNNLTVDLLTLNTTNTSYSSSNYKSGSEELTQNVVLYDSSGNDITGRFSVYRSTFKDGSGYFVRNNGAGPFFRIQSFYRSEGTAANPIQDIRKLSDVAGSVKVEGQLVNLTQGIYFFDNSANVPVYLLPSGTWTQRNASSLIEFRNFQDTSVINFDDPANTLLAASDSDRRAYFVYDYSDNVFVKYNETDTTFSTLGSRPVGEVWNIGVY